MAVNTETAISWMNERKGRVSYSMNSRLGPNSYDCSSAVYYALVSGGASKTSWPVTTETAHDWLLANGYYLLAENRDWNMERGDIIIWGRKGFSVGGGGHVMMALNANDVIHCTYAVNGITINNYNQLFGWNLGTMGGPYVYVYRKRTPNAAPSRVSSTPMPAPRKLGKLEILAGETMAGKYGSGDVRKKALGKKYRAVQTIINERLKAINAATSHKRLAEEVLAGNLGVGDERKQNLGTYYQAVQNIINKR